MKRLIIIGAGDFGRETAYTVKRINGVCPQFEMMGFVDDGADHLPAFIDGYPLLGGTDYLRSIKEETYIVCSINNGRIRQMLVNKAMQNPCIRLATIIDPQTIIAEGAKIGDGAIVFGYCYVAINATLKNNVILNAFVDVGHDDVIGECVTISPQASVAGKVSVGDCCYIGAGAHIIQGHTICEDVTIGAGGVVVKDICEPGTYVGVPVKKIK